METAMTIVAVALAFAAGFWLSAWRDARRRIFDAKVKEYSDADRLQEMLDAKRVSDAANATVGRYLATKCVTDHEMDTLSIALTGRSLAQVRAGVRDKVEQMRVVAGMPVKD